MLLQIDELNRFEHCYLELDDKCFFLREYTASNKYNYSLTNSLISNLKKGMEKKGKPEWKHKLRAIKQCAKDLADSLDPESVQQATLVPIPPSKTKNSPFYDDRMTQILSQLSASHGRSYDIREIVYQLNDTESAYTTGHHPHPYEVRVNIAINEDHVNPTPTTIWLFDDVLTNGAHFRAMKSLLMERFPSVLVFGLFIARCVHLD